jgi:hypothetical protein
MTGPRRYFGPTHECAAPWCSEQIPVSRFACPEDWRRLPSKLSLDITRTYGRRRTLAARMAAPDDLKAAQVAHQAAKDAGVRWYAGHPK